MLHFRIVPSSSILTFISIVVAHFASCTTTLPLPWPREVVTFHQRKREKGTRLENQIRRGVLSSSVRNRHFLVKKKTGDCLSSQRSSFMLHSLFSERRVVWPFVPVARIIHACQSSKTQSTDLCKHLWYNYNTVPTTIPNHCISLMSNAHGCRLSYVFYIPYHLPKTL